MHAGPLARAMFTSIVASESARRNERKISPAPSFKNRGSANGRDRALSGNACDFCQCPAFSASRRRSSGSSVDNFAYATGALTAGFVACARIIVRRYLGALSEKLGEFFDCVASSRAY